MKAEENHQAKVTHLIEEKAKVDHLLKERLTEVEGHQQIVRDAEQALMRVKEELASKIEKRRKMEAEMVEKEQRILGRIAEAKV